MSSSTPDFFCNFLFQHTPDTVIHDQGSLSLAGLSLPPHPQTTSDDLSDHVSNFQGIKTFTHCNVIQNLVELEGLNLDCNKIWHCLQSPATSCPCLVTTTVTRMSITPTTLSPSIIAETHLRVQTSPGQGWADPPPPPRPLVAGRWVNGGTVDSQAPAASRVTAGG